jgi:hypothetical protein
VSRCKVATVELVWQQQEGNVRDIYEVLREKEDAIERVRREVKALRLVVPLLADAKTGIPQPVVSTEASTEPVSQLGEALRTVAPLLVDETEDLDPDVRARLIEAARSYLAEFALWLRAESGILRSKWRPPIQRYAALEWRGFELVNPSTRRRLTKEEVPS